MYNCTKPGNQSIVNATIAHFDFTTAQLVINCTLIYALIVNKAHGNCVKVEWWKGTVLRSE